MTATITSEKETYEANEDINLTVTVLNTNDYDVENVSIEAFLPEELTLKTGETQAGIELLEAGETLTTAVVAVLEAEVTPAEEVEKTPLPATGIGTDILVWAAIALIAVAICAYTLKNRKKQANSLAFSFAL